jgi:hypothetical protein
VGVERRPFCRAAGGARLLHRAPPAVTAAAAPAAPRGPAAAGVRRGARPSAPRAPAPPTRPWQGAGAGGACAPSPDPDSGADRRAGPLATGGAPFRRAAPPGRCTPASPGVAAPPEAPQGGLAAGRCVGAERLAPWCPPDGRATRHRWGRPPGGEGPARLRPRGPAARGHWSGPGDRAPVARPPPRHRPVHRRLVRLGGAG